MRVLNPHVFYLDVLVAWLCVWHRIIIIYKLNLIIIYNYLTKKTYSKMKLRLKAGESKTGGNEYVPRLCATIRFKLQIYVISVR